MISVVVATRNQGARLRLVLAGLCAQRVPLASFEVIVVDDASDDGSQSMVTELDLPASWRVVPLLRHQGRSRARNTGAALARGETLAFLDGDALPGPGWLASYGDVMSAGSLVACGRQFCLPRLEYVADPETGSMMTGDTPSIVEAAMRATPAAFEVTRRIVVEDFERIEASSQPGGYPFPEVAASQADVAGVIARDAHARIRWLGLYPHNFAVTRDLFARAGGFDEEIPFSEGWELGYRLARMGAPFADVEGARSYHLYHYHDFSTRRGLSAAQDLRQQALELIAERSGTPSFVLVSYWLASLGNDSLIPEELLIRSAEELETAWGEIDEESACELRRILELRDAVVL